MQGKPGIESFSKVCQLVHLPAPRACDIAPISKGFILPLEDYGCLWRVEEIMNDEKIRYPLGIMPIMNFRVSENNDIHVSVGLYPAAPRVGISAEDYETLKAVVLEQLNLYLSADPDDDCAYVSTEPQEGFSNGVPIVIDITDAVQLRQFVGPHPPQSDAPLQPYIRAQQKRFHGLREDADAMLSALPEDYQRLTRQFWARMRSMTTTTDSTGRPVLSACWKNAQPGNTKLASKLCSFKEPSAEYAARLRSDDFHADILAPAA